MSAFAPPSGPPPSHQSHAQDPASLSADDIPNDPPPAYTPTAATGTAGGGAPSSSSSSANPNGGHGETTLEVGPSRMDFSGPPPLPDRLENNITGVGTGYGRRPDHALGSQPTGDSSSTGYSAWGVSGQASGWRPPPPPHHPSTSSTSGYAAPSGPPPSALSGKDNPFSDTNQSSSSGAGPSSSRPRPPPPPSAQQQQDTSPTEAPTPGRPLLHRGQLLVYPKGHWCHKCGNTGYKANDPSNPHESDWKKYGKPYNSALAASYTTSTQPGTNPSVTSSANFQRPLPSFPHPQQQQPQHQQNPYGHLPPPPGSWGSYPGQSAHFAPQPRPPPPMTMPQHHYMPHMGGGGQQQIFVQKTPGPIPPGALVVGPGDPRIGGV
ncbi:hypothetical protein I317_07174 [Kwoniella heveanensis CBS 569]|nr:hypothetical protein I317_07174 [Kwoniella heveanensis CBS 569]